jgi:hypothetical protein
MYQLFTSMTLVKKGLIFGFFIAVLNINFSYAQNCSAKLTVEKDRSAKSTYKNDPAIFNMVLTNTSSASTTYIIATQNLKESCATEDKKTSAPNVSLNVEIKNNESSGAANNSLTLKAGETRTFKIYVSIPLNTPYNTWSCIEVSAKANECSQNVATTNLRVFVPEPSEG